MNHTLIAHLAKKHLRIDTLEEQHSDRLDFHTVAVWELKAALEAAYNAGAQSQNTQEQTPCIH